MLSIRAVALISLIGSLLFLPCQAQEQGPPADDAAGTVSYSDSAIEAEASDSLDPQIANRLRGIYDALPAFSEIEVSVSEGVVRLSGLVPERDQIKEAEDLARRIDGVVAVENSLEADLSVDTRLGPAAARAQDLASETIALLPLLGLALVVIIVFWILGNLIGRQAWLWRRLAPNALLASLFRTIVPGIFLLIGIVLALTILDAVAILSAVLGAAGVLGLAIGFAVRDTIENFIASVMLSLRQPFRAGDLVDVAGQQGNVVRLTSRATILMTPDGNHVRIPNADVFKAVILNYSRNPERRLQFDLGIDAADDSQSALSLGLDTMRALDFILDDPTPTAWVETVGDSNIVLTFAPWIDQGQTDFLKARSAAIRAVKIALEDGGFTLPEPIYRLRIDEVPGTLSTIAAPSESSEGAPAPQEAAPKPPSAKAPRAPEEPVDTSADTTIEEKVRADRATSGEEDLLSENAPTEFGDAGNPPR